MKSILLLIILCFIFADEYYTIVNGDTLGSISAKFRVNLKQLVTWNNIPNPNQIYVGQKIIIRKDSYSIPEPGVYFITDAQMKKMGWTNYNLADLNRCINKFHITTTTRLRHFISQCSYESECGKWTQELGETSNCLHYDGRTDLGNIQPGDACKFKGAGYFKLTGRYNYQKFANYMGDQNIMSGVSYVAVNYPWTSAGYWWYSNDMNSFCDNGATVEQITRKVNGGINGLNERQKYYEKACRIFYNI